MAEFVLANNYSEILDKVFRQVSGTTVGTKFAPPCACIYMYEVERVFLETQHYKLLIWFRYIHDVIFFIWTHGEEKLKSFLTTFNNYNLNLLNLHSNIIDRISISWILKLSHECLHKTNREISVPSL